VKVPFDQGVPAPLRRALPGHEIETAFECGWSRLGNGELNAAAGAARFDVVLTTDRNLKYQQNLSERRIAIVALSTTSWPRIQRATAEAAHALDAAAPGTYAEATIP
jgi:hypothetical protein